jgi:C1A family cysteine protease
MTNIFTLVFLLYTSLVYALPDKHTDLLDYVIMAPDQGETNTCMFIAATGAMEIILNKKHGIKHPQPMSKYDLSEIFTIHAPSAPYNGPWHVATVSKFNNGVAVHAADLPFAAWNGDQINYGVWRYPSNFKTVPRLSVPKIETKKLFVRGGKYATHVLNDEDIETIKEALVKYNSPILVNYNDESYWHMVLIVGYQDGLQGDCYDTDPKYCRGLGSFYVRDSFGVMFEVRDYDWFKIKGNAAFVVSEAATE